MLDEIESCLENSFIESLPELFCELLGWSRPSMNELSLDTGAPVNHTIDFIPVAELSGLPVFRVDWYEDQLPNVTQRRTVHKALVGTYREHMLCYVTPDDNQVAFVWARNIGENKVELRVLPYEKDVLARTTIERIEKLAFTLEELEQFDGEPTVTDVTSKLDHAFDVESITRRFFDAYSRIFAEAESQISGIEGDAKRLFTQKLFNRLLFIRFLEKKRWLSFDNRRDYLKALWEDYCSKRNENGNFYRDRLQHLFFAGLNAPNEVNIMDINRGGFLRSLIGNVPYLNGGLFEQEEDDKNTRISVPDQAIEPILKDLFYRFNFTVTETTPLDIEVAVDPEMLGKIFEKLVTGRHESGAYYTPKSIVAFMCTEALKGYLGGYESLIDDHDASGISVPTAKELVEKLSSITVCDPACGSGAYLLGMLHELHELMRLLDTRADQLTARDDYQRKLHIIQNNLYGVDNDLFAVNIARLRLWLALVVDFQGDKPEPLPNLDFKIEAGDSITAPNPQEAMQGFRDELIRGFHQKKCQYMREQNPGKRRTLLTEIAQLRQQIADWTHPNGDTESFDWAVEFAEIFVEGGFDIIIANPPYGLKCNDPLRFQYFPRVSGEEIQSKDSYGLFMARALQLLKTGGFFTFIVSDTWRTIRSHYQLRKELLQKTTILYVLDLPTWVFDATVNTCIISLSRQSPSEEHELIAGDLRNLAAGDWRELGANLTSVAARGPDIQTVTCARYTYKQSIIAGSRNLSFFIGSQRLHRLMWNADLSRASLSKVGLLQKSEAYIRKTDGCQEHESPLSVVDLGNIADVKRGMDTGDTRFCLRKDPNERGRLQVVDPNLVVSDKEMTMLSKSEKQQGIETTGSRSRNKYLIPYDKGGSSDAQSGWLPNYFLPVRYYINWSSKLVEKYVNGIPVTVNSGTPYMRNFGFFFKEGITFSRSGVYAPTFRTNAASAFDSEGCCIFCDIFSREFLLGILCSKLVRYVIKCFLNHTVHAQVDNLKDVPIAIPNSSETAEQIRMVVSKIIEKQKSEPRYLYHLCEQRELDSLIDQLYGLTSEDTRELELWYCRRYPVLAEAQGLLWEVQQKYSDHLTRCERILSKPPRYWKSHPILELIAQGEGQKLEFKETFEADARTGNKHPGVLSASLKTVAAFLNTSGGTLLIGVSDSGEVKGLSRDFRLCGTRQDTDGLEQKMRGLLRNRFSPKSITSGKVKIDFEILPEGTVCHVRVEPLPKKDVVHLDDDIYIRDGNTTIRLQGAELTQWHRNRLGT